MKVSIQKFLKTNVEKLSVSGPEQMLLKTSYLWFSSKYIDEKKEERRWAEIMNSELSMAANAKSAHQFIG